MGALYIAGMRGHVAEAAGHDVDEGELDRGRRGSRDRRRAGARQGGSIVVGWEQEGNSFDPAIGYDLISWDSLCNCTTAAPMIFGAAGEGPFPNAAAAVEISDGGTLYTMHLRPGVRFQNGRTVTAHDYAYSWGRVLDPKNASWAASYLYPIEGAEAVFNGKAKTVKGLTVADPMTLKIRLHSPDITFINILAQPYMTAVAKEAVTRYGAKFAKHVVSTGPFMLSSYDQQGQTATFKRNPHYFWKGLPYLDSVVYRWGTSAQTELLQLQHGNIDSVGEGIGPSLVPQVSAQPSLAKYIVKVQLAAVRWIGLNLKRAPFTDVRVRQALNWAINREQITRIGYGESVPWGLPFPQNLPNFHRVATPYGYDPQKAKALLASAGAHNLSFQLTTTSDDPNPSIAQILQQQFKAVGVNMSIQTVSQLRLQHVDREEELHRGADPLVPGAADGAGHPELQLHVQRLVELLELLQFQGRQARRPGAARAQHRAEQRVPRPGREADRRRRARPLSRQPQLHRRTLSRPPELPLQRLLRHLLRPPLEVGLAGFRSHGPARGRTRRWPSGSGCSAASSCSR